MSRTKCTLAEFNRDYWHTTVGKAMATAITELLTKNTRRIELRICDIGGTFLPDCYLYCVVLAPREEPEPIVYIPYTLDRYCNHYWKVFSYK